MVIIEECEWSKEVETELQDIAWELRSKYHITDDLFQGKTNVA